MCFRYTCMSCRQLQAYFCGPPFADMTNDFPPLCRANAHTQHAGFKCMTCERLDAVTRKLEVWLRFHPDQRIEPVRQTASTNSGTLVRERVYPTDARSPWFSPLVRLSNLKRAMVAAGVNEDNVHVRIEAERKLRQKVPPEANEIEETAAHKRDHCCFCLDNFTCLPIEVSTSSTPTSSSDTEVMPSKKRPRSNSPARREVKRPRKW